VALRLPRHLGALRDLDVGQYLVDEATPTRVREVHVRCPLCGGVTEIAATHSIARDGRVTPAVVCPTETCSSPRVGRTGVAVTDLARTVLAALVLVVGVAWLFYSERNHG
jgi:hypothetical protein